MQPGPAMWKYLDVSKKLLNLNLFVITNICRYRRMKKTEKIEYVYDKIVPDKIPDPDWVTKDQTIFLPPGVFARDNIQSNAFRGDQAQDCPDENLRIALNRKRPAAYIPFTLTEPIPSAPNKP